MQSKKLETLKRNFNSASFQPLVESFQPLVEYFQELEQKGVDVVVPEIVSKRLKIPFSDTLFLLSQFEKNHLLRRAYQVFSSNHFPLGEFPSPRSIPKKISDPNTGEDIQPDEYFVDLIFHILPG